MVNGADLNCLLSKILDLCAGKNINVQFITMDGTVVNFISIKLFRGKLGHSLEKNNGDFTRYGYNYNRMEIYYLTTRKANAIWSKI